MEAVRVDTFYAGAVLVKPGNAVAIPGAVPYVSYSGNDPIPEEWATTVEEDEDDEFEGIEKADITAEAQIASKRPVGRPKGSKNKVKV